MIDQSKSRFLRLPEGETVTIRILEPAPTHVIKMTQEELERHRQLEEQHKKECPWCAAGAPFKKITKGVKRGEIAAIIAAGKGRSTLGDG
jgi:hypothetical protein